MGELAPAIGQLHKRIVVERQLTREWGEATREIVNISSSATKARTHVGKLKDSWQHLLRDRASRTLTYNDEQFHILEKIKMQETIRVLQDLLQKECTPSINQTTDALADWYKMAQTTYLQTEILHKDIVLCKDEIDTFAVTLKEAQQERYFEALTEAKTKLNDQKSAWKKRLRKQKQEQEEEKLRQLQKRQVEVEQQQETACKQQVSKSKKVTTGESKQVRRALRSILTTQDEVWGILRENTRLIEQFGQLAVAASSATASTAATPNGSAASFDASAQILAEFENGSSAAAAAILATTPKNY